MGICNINVIRYENYMEVWAPHLPEQRVAFFGSTDALPKFKLFLSDCLKFVRELTLSQAIGMAWWHNMDNLTDYVNVVGRNVSVNRQSFLDNGMWDEDLAYSETTQSRGWEDSVTADTPVVIKKKNLIDIVPISDLYGLFHNNRSPDHIYTQDGWSRIVDVVSHEVRKPIYRVRVASGFVDVTGDHSLMQDRKKKLVENLKRGDEIDLVEVPIVAGKGQCDFAWALGLFVAEGSYGEYEGICSRRRKGRLPFKEKYKSRQWKITNTNVELLERAKKQFEKAFPQFEFRIWFDKKYNVYHLYVCKNTSAIIDEFKEIGVYTKDREKKIPRFILNGSKRSMSDFLDGYFCGDGHLERSRSRKIYTTTSKTLASGVLCLIKQLGGNAHVFLRKDKLNAISIREYGNRRLGSNQFKTITGEPCNRNRIKEIFVVSRKKQIVYDIETESHTFVTGVGCIVAHNTELGLRMHKAGLGFVMVPSWTVHLEHPRMVKDGGTENIVKVARKHPWFLNDRPDWWKLRYDREDIRRKAFPNGK